VNTCYAYIRRCCTLTQVTLSIHLNDSQVDKFEKMIPVQLAQPPWNYTKALEKGIQVYY